VGSVVACAVRFLYRAGEGERREAPVVRSRAEPLAMTAPMDEGATVELAVEALLREHPEARVCALSDNGLIVPMPGRVRLHGQETIEGRALIDLVVAEDRKKVIDLWIRGRESASVTTKVHLLDSPSQRSVLHFLDMRPSLGVVLGIVLRDEDADDDEPEVQEAALASARLCTLTEDEHANVLDCDDAFTQMCGYTREEVVGRSVLDQIHPDDQARAVESWLQMLSTGRDQHYRGRRKNKDGRWLWVDTTLHHLLGREDSDHVLVELIDVSAEMAAQEALQEREELLRRLTDAMPVGLVQLDVDANVVYHNAHLRDIFRGTTATTLGVASTAGASDESHAAEPSDEASAPAAPAPLEALLDTVTAPSMEEFRAALSEVLACGSDRDLELDLDVPPGEWRRVLLTIRALLRPGGEVGGVIMCALDVTDSARARQELERRATFDALTHAHNRSSILASLQDELDLGRFTGVIYVDLDDFKPVNDIWGHAAGDELLRLVAERLAGTSRSGDEVGRLGGDEFLLLLRNIPGPQTAMRTAERIARSLGSSFEISAGRVALRASLGVACVTPEEIAAQSIAAEELVRRADAAMYSSKAGHTGTPVLAA
jgi:diguanylate cyclase (GGDEF)-like protein/PAS domain S-box-containing protein